MLTTIVDQNGLELCVYTHTLPQLVFDPAGGRAIEFHYSPAQLLELSDALARASDLPTSFAGWWVEERGSPPADARAREDFDLAAAAYRAGRRARDLELTGT